MVVNLSYNKIITFLGYYDNSNFLPSTLYNYSFPQNYTHQEMISSKQLLENQLFYIMFPWPKRKKNTKGVAFLMLIQ
jgi:hypothetical protein